MTASVFFSGTNKSYEILDIEKVTVDGPSAIKTFVLDKVPAISTYDAIICGGGMGGCASALTALELNRDIRICLTEETSWLGGQMTSQGVSALDENKWVETTGATASYQELRDKLRQYYRERRGACESALATEYLHPGLSWVTRLSFEPEVGLEALEAMLAPHAKRLDIKRRTRVIEVKLEYADSITIKAVLTVNLDDGTFNEIHADYVVDATELGDIMPLANIPYFTGSDDRSRTGEPHAPEKGDPHNVQDFTYPFILTAHPGENHVIEKPAYYDEFNKAGKFSFFGFKMYEEYDGICPVTGKQKHFLPFWTYRRLIASELFSDYPHDLSMINWDANDLRGHDILDVDNAARQEALKLAKNLSLGFVYWLQTEAPRDDGGNGYPEFKLEKDLLGSSDGLSLYPYIREARRLDAQTIVVENDIVAPDDTASCPSRANLFGDSVGIGHYPVDIHGAQEIPGTAQLTRPFQIPYGALVADDFPNFIAGCKNIGVTHITNGAYRLHPIEWAIGTACGAAIALARATGTPLNEIGQNETSLRYLQALLISQGAPIFWFDDLTREHELWAEAQIGAVTGAMLYDTQSLSAVQPKLV